MARGWESKSIEEQIEASREEGLTRQDSSDAAKRSSRAGGDSSQKTSLLLARTRLLKDIETTQNERYRQHLQMTLAAIEKQLLDIE
jgi:hypothetical protein